MNNEPEIDKEGMDNLVAVFSLLLKWDREQNPHLYQKIKPPPKSIENVPDKQGDNRHL